MIQTNRDLTILWNSDPPTVQNVSTNTSFEGNEALLTILNEFSDPKDKDEASSVLSDITDTSTVEELLDAGILVESSQDTTMWTEYNWRVPQKHFKSSRNIEFADKTTDTEKKKRILEGYTAGETPTVYKELDGDRVELPPLRRQDNALQDALESRRTRRHYDETLPFRTFTDILRAGTKEMRRRKARVDEAETSLRFTESLYSSFELYIGAYDVERIEQGLYYYDQQANELVQRRSGDHRRLIVEMTQGQKFLKDAPVCMFLTSVFERFMFRYRHERAYRELFISAGELVQQILVTASGNDVAGFMTPALKDTKTCDFLDLTTGEEETLYYVTLGN